MRSPRTEREREQARASYDQWLRELKRLEDLMATSQSRSPEYRDGLRADIAECKRTIRRYEQMLEKEATWSAASRAAFDDADAEAMLGAGHDSYGSFQ